MANITFSIEDDVLAKAKGFAAKHAVSLNSLIAAYLSSIGQKNTAGEKSKNDEVLLAYSLGKISLMTAAQKLQVNDPGVVFALLRASGYPFPKLSDDVIDRQVDANIDFFRKALKADKPKAKKTARP
jgi:hypothetical protein